MEVAEELELLPSSEFETKRYRNRVALLNRTDREVSDAIRPTGSPAGRGPDGEYLALVNAQNDFTDAFHHARVLGRAMLAEFDKMNVARSKLSEQGVKIGVEFPPQIQAALRKHRELLEGAQLQVPSWISGD